MKLRVFKADKGDALLLVSKNKQHNVLIDGGMGGAYRAHCARTISTLKQLDVVYVSHIDRDHVEGIYQMLDDTVAWQVHEFLRQHGHHDHKPPKNPKPPKIDKFWQNSFHGQVGANAGAIEDILASQVGRRKKVTTPNLASLMFYVKEGTKTLLLTGDGHCDDLLAGLESAHLLRPDGTLRVNVLKVPHHGSEHNTSLAFCQAITADKYVFCGNGADDNPDLDVVKAYIDSRIGPAARRSSNPETGRKFRLIFNYHPDNETGARKTHLKKILRHVEARTKSSSQLSSTFIKGSSANFTV